MVVPQSPPEAATGTPLRPDHASIATPKLSCDWDAGAVLRLNDAPVAS